MSGPIKPSEVRAATRSALPEEVFSAFNDAIARTWDGTRAVVVQSEVADAIASAMKIPREQVFRRRLLNVEEAYRDAGWRVEYDKPGFNETYAATFTFTKGRMRPGDVGGEDG